MAASTALMALSMPCCTDWRTPVMTAQPNWDALDAAATSSSLGIMTPVISWSNSDDLYSCDRWAVMGSGSTAVHSEDMAGEEEVQLGEETASS